MSPLDAQSEVLNERHRSAVKNGNGHQPKTLEALQRVAARIHGRHPACRRDISVRQVIKQLAAILKFQHVPAAQQEQYLEVIDATHAALCETAGWTKEGGEYAKGLENWLAPRKERYLAKPPVIAAVSEPPLRMVL